MDLREHPGLDPLGHPQVTGRARTEVCGQRLPLAPSADAVDDPRECDTVRNTRPSTLRLRALGRQKRLDARPKGVGYVEEVLGHGP